MADIGFSKTIKKNVESVSNNLIEGVLSVFGQAPEDSRKRYPDTIGGITVSKVTNQPEYKTGNWRKSLGYSFQVHRVAAGASKTTEALGWSEFRLQINLQEMTQDEIFAIEVTPTFRGVVVEHHGQILKDITISGTTGKSPLAGTGGPVKGTGRPLLASGHSGYEEFNEFRSYIRAYVEAKRVDSRDGGELRLVFRNFKDSEFLFVEPQKFTMKRSAAKSILYDYVFQMKAIGVADAPAKKDSESFGLLGDIFAVSNQINDLLDTYEAIFQESFTLIARFEQDAINTIFQPIQSLNAGIRSFKAGINTVIRTTRSQVEGLKREIERVENNINDGLGRDMVDYNNMAGRTPTLSGTTGRQSTFTELTALHGFQAAKRGLGLILSENEFFEEEISVQNRDIENFYDGKITLPVPSSVRAVEILGGDTIQIVATRELGNPDRFKDLVILNNLKPPYIDDAGGSGVLKTGEKILIPQNSQQESTGVKRNKGFEISRFLSESEKALGVDIRLDNNNDLAVANTNDLDLIAGVENLSQAVLIRLHLEPGALKRHLDVGVGLPVGEKVTGARLAEIRSNIISSFSSDLRIESVASLELIQEGGTTIINAVLKIKDLDLPVPLPITVSGTA